MFSYYLMFLLHGIWPIPHKTFHVFIYICISKYYKTSSDLWSCGYHISSCSIIKSLMQRSKTLIVLFNFFHCVLRVYSMNLNLIWWTTKIELIVVWSRSMIEVMLNPICWETVSHTEIGLNCMCQSHQLTSYDDYYVDWILG